MASAGSPRSEYTLRRRVHFYETDAAGIVHFSIYFRYMEEAEHALWRDAGLSIANRTAAVGFPRIAASFEYHRPLRVEDEFDVCITVVAKSEKTMQYRCVLRRGDETIATGSLTIVCVSTADQPMKAIPIPPDIASRFTVAATQ
jgi:YbgC/YbaW family acyl-CoA thioester hydrolase